MNVSPMKFQLTLILKAKDYAIKSLNQGAHIFIEKPLAETVEDALEIIDLARKK